MALVQISDPATGTSPRQQQSRYAVGIDLGTTNSLVATMREGVAVTLPDAQQHHSLPSVVRYLSDGQVVVGAEALAAAITDPFNTIASVKRLLGRQVEELKTLRDRLPYRFEQTDSTVLQIQTAAGLKTPIEVSADILKQLAKQAQVGLQTDYLDGVVITVPAYFDDAQRQATKDAAKIAGLPVMRLLNEPTAAAVAYGLDDAGHKQGHIAVFDLGGGTFDVSILKLDQGVFKVLATGGDTTLGGDDFDRVIAENMIAVASLNCDDDPSVLRALMQQARHIKETLTGQEEISCSIDLPNASQFEYRLSRTELEQMIKPWINQTEIICRHVLDDAKLDPTDIDDIVMVGGSSRMPLVCQRVAQLFGRSPLVEIDPDKVVAMGAAIQADILVGNKPDSDVLLLDVTPLSLGIETMGSLVEKIVPRNTPIPVSRAQEFTTFKDGQTGMSIHVLQGERELVDDCRSLARFELKGVPPMVAGAARIRVTFQVDADGLLAVEARELTRNVMASVEVRPSYGLSDTEIEQVLTDSIAHASADVIARKIREQQLEARRVVEALDAAMLTDGDELLETNEREQILTARNKLASLFEKSNADEINTAIKTLEQCSEAYVARRMNRSIRTAMRGQSVDKLGANDA